MRLYAFSTFVNGKCSVPVKAQFVDAAADVCNFAS